MSHELGLPKTHTDATAENVLVLGRKKQLSAHVIALLSPQ